MAFRQYTKCFPFSPGDKPFNKEDLVSFALGNATPGLAVAIGAFLTGMPVVGFGAIAVQYAATISAVAKQWLYHRLVCISGDQCAVGTVELNPETDTLLGTFDNDQFFDLRLMPHRAGDLYKAWNAAFLKPTASPTNPSAAPGPGPSLDGLTELTHENDIYLDGAQGSTLIAPVHYPDLPYSPTDAESDVPEVVAITKDIPDAKVSRSTLHVEAEGNFWQAMLDSAPLQGAAVGTGAAVGAAAGAAAGCEIGGFFGPIGCAIGAIIGAIAGALGGGAVGGYIAASAAFNSEPGDVNDANVGDMPLGALQQGDRVAVFGTHVYDGFHDGWLELHPLKAIVRVNDPDQYPEWDPNFIDNGKNVPAGLTAADMKDGLKSTTFRAAAEAYKRRWCDKLSEAFAPPTRVAQARPENRWTIHPGVDGCDPDPDPPDPPPVR